MKGFIIDTFATIVFFTIIAGLTEFFIAGMALQQVILARAIMIPVMILSGRPYGLWRDRVFRFVQPKTTAMRVLADIGAFLVFQVPVYVCTLLIAGATVSEIQAAVAAAILFMVLLSRPFGLFLEVLRRWGGTEPEQGEGRA